MKLQDKLILYFFHVLRYYTLSSAVFQAVSGSRLRSKAGYFSAHPKYFRNSLVFPKSQPIVYPPPRCQVLLGFFRIFWEKVYKIVIFC